jgi:hypothetical protein
MPSRYNPQVPPASIEHHYTPPNLAARLVSFVPLRKDDAVLDPAAGANRVFARHFGVHRRMECEIAAGSDFLAMPLVYDWAITNPPYHLLWRFIEKAARESRKGFAFLVNINGFNSLTPRRLRLLAEQQFSLRHLHVCQVRRWFGRYYFVVFAKEVSGACAITWDEKPWE